MATGSSEASLVPIDAAFVRQLARTEAPVHRPSYSHLLGTPEPYRIGVSDSLAITVFGHPELASPSVTFVSGDPSGLSGATGFTVSEAGEITYPYVGRLRIAGLTQVEALEMLQQRLRQYIKEPKVGLKVGTFRSQRAYLEGEVRQPGIQILNDVPVTLQELLGRAGGLTPKADRSRVQLTRAGQTTTIDMRAQGSKATELSRIMIQSGDIVRLEEQVESRVYVLGEVARPGPTAMRDGRLSLHEALGDVGGVNLGTSNPRQIYVVRPGPGGDAARPVVYHLDGRHVTSLVLADAFPLQPRDVVFVDSVPLVTWNRIISLILPSAQAIITTRSVAQP
jgi:polysaccharide biosynthesis/export protein